MTFVEAVRLLRDSGLHVEVGHDHALTATVDTEQPWGGPEPKGSRGAHGLRLSIRQTNGQWLVELGPSEPTESCPTLEVAVSRALAILHEHRKSCCLWQHGDQFAAFNADDPCPVIEEALVGAGWLTPRKRPSTPGLSFLNGCCFRLELVKHRRIVLVTMSRRDDGLYHLAIRCYKIAVATGQTQPIRLPVRTYSRDGNRIPNLAAPALSYEVARVVHDALEPVVADLRWAVNREPEPSSEEGRPVEPGPT